MICKKIIWFDMIPIDSILFDMRRRYAIRKHITLGEMKR